MPINRYGNCCNEGQQSGGGAVDYGLICAAGVLAALPPLIIGFLLQKGLLSGFTAGGVKG